MKNNLPTPSHQVPTSFWEFSRQDFWKHKLIARFRKCYSGLRLQYGVWESGRIWIQPDAKDSILGEPISLSVAGNSLNKKLLKLSENRCKSLCQENWPVSSLTVYFLAQFEMHFGEGTVREGSPPECLSYVRSICLRVIQVVHRSADSLDRICRCLSKRKCAFCRYEQSTRTHLLNIGKSQIRIRRSGYFRSKPITSSIDVDHNRIIWAPYIINLSTKNNLDSNISDGSRQFP